MPSSRRSFLKVAMATASIAFERLQQVAFASSRAADPAISFSGSQNGTQSGVRSASSPYNRAVGAYPGDPAEDFSPVLVPDSTAYRNLALLRPAYHSSSYDYNLTAQLVTDGIKDTKRPRSSITVAATLTTSAAVAPCPLMRMSSGPS